VTLPLQPDAAALQQDAAALQRATSAAHDCVRLRDGETGHHLERVSRITRLIAEELAASHGLTAAFIDQLSLFARLHDIGKIAIPDAILLKPGRLDAAEMAVMRTHVEKGLELLAQVLADHAIPPQPATELMAAVIGTHHERLDGSGYPAGLRGEAIPLAGRIVAVADVFDALTSRRLYRRSATVAEGLALVQQQAAEGLLDPVCVAALAARQAELESIVAFSADAAPDR
jgi:response regulator RpfG family c-di-GMP phosphodiesterase